MAAKTSFPNSQLPTPLLVIVGQTATGKSALAMDLAKLFNGEIICADSRTVYKTMDIATAKPSKSQQKRIKHHLLDLIYPNQTFNAAQFKVLANHAINDISARGKVPILAGGSGLYIDAVIYDFQFAASAADPNIRAKLSKLSVTELQRIIERHKLDLPANLKNHRHLIRQIELNGFMPSRRQLRANTILIGLSKPNDIIKSNINERIKIMVKNGLIQETRRLLKQYGADAPGLSAPGYKAIIKYLNGQSTRSQALQEFNRNDWQLAKRQKTWFKRNKSIQWLGNRDQIIDIVTTFLYKN